MAMIDGDRLETDDARDRISLRADERNEQREVIGVATDLHHLALRYWSEEHPEDAKRVASQAVRILRARAPDCEVLPEIVATLRELDEI